MSASLYPVKLIEAPDFVRNEWEMEPIVPSLGSSYTND